MTDAAPAASASAATPQFAIQRLYVKDTSFELPLGAVLFNRPWQPQVQQELSTRATPLDNDLHEVVLMVTITGKFDDQPGFIVEVQQAGIFLIKGFAPDQLRHAVGAHCPSVLFPYAREAIDNLMVRGSLPPLMLPPINFDALYQQAMAQQTAQAPTDVAH